MEPILILDDDLDLRVTFERILSAEGHCVGQAGTMAEAMRLSQSQQFALVLAGLQLPDGDAKAVLRWYSVNLPETPVVVLAGSVSAGLEAMRAGALDYLLRPLEEPDALRMVVRRVLEQRRMTAEREILLERESSGRELVAGHPRMVQLLEAARKLAGSNAAMLLLGEPGAGKQALARWIHHHSARAGSVFVAVNAAAQPAAAMANHLFGFEAHPGRFERANGGTLYLAEAGAMDGESQARLLRALQQKTLERAGSTRQITLDVRLIAGSSRDLKAMVAAQAFREDLFSRLNALPLEIPPLRERGADVIELARRFLERAGRELGKPLLHLAPAAENALLSYTWPGNVRELENLMERMAMLCTAEVRAEDLSLGRVAALPPMRFKEIERLAIENALRHNAGNRTRAARELGISLRTLQYRLKEYGVNP